MISMAPYGFKVSEYYDVSLFWVNFLAALEPLVRVIAGIPISYAIETYGVSKIILMPSLFNSVGLSVKCLINESFWYAIIG